MTHLAMVSTELALRLILPGGTSLRIVAGLRYEAADPWAVRVAFHTGSGGDGTVEWVFARQLLTDGVSSACGQGDVRVWPALHGRDRVVNLAMASPSGSALFEMDRNDLVGYLEQTYRVVPTGAESEVVDLDAEIALLRA